MVEVTDNDEHSSLQRSEIAHERKKFYKTSPLSQRPKLFSSKMTLLLNKLVGSLLANFYWIYYNFGIMPGACLLVDNYHKILKPDGVLPYLQMLHYPKILQGPMIYFTENQ